MTLIFDTETTGKAFFRLPVTHPTQPRMCQLAAALYDDTGVAVARVALPIHPNNAWRMPAEAEAIHSWSTARLQACGVAAYTALLIFVDLVTRASTLVAFNIAFDRIIVEGELCRAGLSNVIANHPNVRCAMLESMPHCKLPGKFGDYKWPKLSEAHTHFFGRPHEGAHDALADVEATARVWFAMRKLDTPAIAGDSNAWAETKEPVAVPPPNLPAQCGSPIVLPRVPYNPISPA